LIAQRDLSIISNNLLKENGGRRIPEQSIELDYALGWFLAKLAQHPYGEKLAFKGGTALRRCHLGEYRFSEDLDFTLLNDDDFDTVTKAFDEVAAGVAQETGMAFSYRGPDRVSHENSHTFYMGFTGPMDRPREFKVDVTRTECIVAHLERKPVIVTYPVFDFPGDCAVKVYSIDEIVTEKLLAPRIRNELNPGICSTSGPWQRMWLRSRSAGLPHCPEAPVPRQERGRSICSFR